MAPAEVAVDEIQKRITGLVAQRLAVNESGLLGEILDHGWENNTPVRRGMEAILYVIRLKPRFVKSGSAGLIRLQST